MAHTIGVSKQSNMVPSLLVRYHPQKMWYREAIQNALQATQEYIKSKNIEKADVLVRTVDVQPGLIKRKGKELWKDKLSVYNLGGMTPTELQNAIEIGGTNKTASFKENFGIGIKTSVLEWSDLLMITYKDGVGYFSWLGTKKTSGQDFDVVAWSDDGEGNPIIECTDWIRDNAEARNYDLDQDFTDIVILGKEVNQNTYKFTYGFAPGTDEQKKLTAQHIKKNLGLRYFRLPSNIRIKFLPSANTFDVKDKSKPVYLVPYSEALEDAKGVKNFDGKVQHEVVCLTGGIKIHYIHEPRSGEKYSQPEQPASFKFLDGQGQTTAFSGLVYRDEVYSPISNDKGWRHVAMTLGIHDKQKHFRIYVEYPESKVSPDQYRERLVTDEENKTVKFDSDETLKMIFNNRPTWFEELSKDTEKEDTGSWDDKLKKLLEDYFDLENPLKGSPNGNSDKGSEKKIKRSKRNTTDDLTSDSDKDDNKDDNQPVQRKPKTNPNILSVKTPKIEEATESDMEEINGNFCVFYAGGDPKTGRDVIRYNPNYKRIESLASKSVGNVKSVKYDEAEKFESWAKELVLEQYVLSASLWTMICRSRQKQGKMDRDLFRSSTTSDHIETYLFTSEIGIFQSVSSQLDARAKKIAKEIKADADSEEDTTIVQTNNNFELQKSIDKVNSSSPGTVIQPTEDSFAELLDLEQ